MKKLMIRKHKYLVGFILSCACIAYGAEQGRLESEEIILSKSPVPLYSDSSASDSEGDGGGEVNKPSRVKKAKEFFDTYRQKRSQKFRQKIVDSDYESEREDSESEEIQGSVKESEGSQKNREKNRALEALSLKLDKKIKALNNFAASREDVRKEFEELAKKFVEEVPALGHGGSDQEIKDLIESKVSKIRHPARVTWEVWNGKVD